MKGPGFRRAGLSILAIAALGSSACREPRTMEELQARIHQRYPEVPKLSPEALYDLQGSSPVGPLREEEAEPGREPIPGPLLLDVRQPEEYAVSHLAGALLAPDLPAALEVLEGEEKDRAIVVYCSVGYRSARLAQELSKEGFRDVRNLEGSIFAWANAGYPVFRGKEPVQRVHPYNRRWRRYLSPELRAFDPVESLTGARGSDTKQGQ